jgi:ParB/RepB/Spo0J family partition protein
MASENKTNKDISLPVAVERLTITDIDPSPFNTRRASDDRAIKDLMKSIREQGLLQPITVRRRDGRFETVFGNRRLEASKRLNNATIDAQVKEYSNDDAFILNLTENVQREDMDPIDVANAVHHLHESDPITWTYAAIGRKIGKSRGWVFEMAKLTDRVAPEVINIIAAADQHGKIAEGKLDYRSAMELARKISDQDKQVELVSTLIGGGIKGVEARRIINVVARHPDEEISDVVSDVQKQPAKFTIDSEDMNRITQGKAHGVTVQFLDPKVKEHEDVELYSKVSGAQVDKIIRKRVSGLNDVDATVNGFNTVAQLKKNMTRKYGQLEDDNFIFTVHFAE